MSQYAAAQEGPVRKKGMVNKLAGGAGADGLGKNVIKEGGAVDLCSSIMEFFILFLMVGTYAVTGKYHQIDDGHPQNLNGVWAG